MSEYVLDNAMLLIGDGQKLQGHLVIQNDRICSVESGRYHGGLKAENLQGVLLSPGMIDLMVLGGFNLSILRDDPAELARRYLRLGVTSLQFCIACLPHESTQQIVAQIARAQAADHADAAHIIGLYMEGPFQSPHLSGASLREHARPPTPELVERILQDAGEVLTMINVAPGLDGDVDAVRRFHQAGKIVSMAHSDAPAEGVLTCVEAGTSVIGHVWDNNAGRIGDSGVQQPTIEHVALTDERVRFIHLICDGTHVHPVMVRLVLQARGVGVICLVTDAVVRAGCDDGPYLNDDGRTFQKKAGVGRTDQGWLCGSALLLPDHLRNFMRFTGLPPERAIRAVTGNPATSMRLGDRIGFLRAGLMADLVAWDASMRVRRVWRGSRGRTGVELRGGRDMSSNPAQERFDLGGKTALVTGGSRGIGRGIAIGLAQHGADVAIVYRSAAREAEQVVEAIRGLGRRAWSYQQDLADTEQIAGLASRVWADCGRIDILVNNAGMAYLEPFDDITPEHWRRTLAVNLDAVFFLTQAVAAKMIGSGIAGRIINLSSKNGLVAEAGLAHYNASKGGLELLTQTLAIELGEHGITVNTLAPGIIETEIAGEFHLPAEFFEYYKQHIPLQHRFGQVEDCVGAAILLASGAGAYITGQHIVIDGGVLCEQVPRLQFMRSRKA